MSWVLALPMCQEILMVIEILAYKINKFKTGHPVQAPHQNGDMAGDLAIFLATFSSRLPGNTV